MELWRNVLSRGQDAMCFKCRQHSGEEVNTNMIVCDQCARIKAKANFDEAMQFYYHIFDECCHEMIILMGYSFARFKSTLLFQKLLNDIDNL